MGFVVVILIISALLWLHSKIIAIILLLFASLYIIKKQMVNWIAVFIAAFFIPLYFYSHNDFKRIELPFDYESKEHADIDFRLTDELKVDGNLLTGSMKIQNKAYQFFYKIQNESEKNYLMQRKLFFKRCHALVEFQHIIPNTNYSGFNYDTFLFHNHKVGSLKLTKINWQACHPSKLSLTEHIKLYRKNIALEMHHSQVKHSAYLIALTLGDTTYLSKDDMDELKTLGIYHLYAISGSHVAVISVFLYFFLRRAQLPLAMCQLMLVILLPIYMVFTGGQPSVFRSTIFILLIIFNPDKRLQISDLLSLTFIINLLYDPFSIFDIGFQLSYVICFSFILILPLYKDTSQFFQFLLINLVSQFVTLPILLYHFNNNYFIGLFTNILYIPLFSVVIFPCCTFVLILFMTRLTSPFLLNIVDCAFILNDYLTKLFLNFSHLELVVKHQSIVFYVILMVAILKLFSVKISHKVTALVLITILFLVSISNRHDRIHFLDVGQGDAIVMELENKVIMIDTGGQIDFGEVWEKRENAQNISEKTTIPFLKYNGISKIDALILTHPDMDHFGETEHLIEAGVIKSIILNPNAFGSEKYKKVIELAEKKKVELYDVNDLLFETNHNDNIGALLVGKNYQLKLYNSGETGEENNDSIVALLKYAKPGRNILFLGDLGKVFEAEILSQITDRINIVKIGHHGSNTSTSEALIKRYPEYGIISAGRKNRYNHPHDETIQLLRQHHIKIFNTQTDGRISIDLSTGEIETQYQNIFKRQ
ncbi:DNA internalization-related competence protein ComEC/Rec2 [Macrococcus equi]|uniref:DNA internalization-related competence protein ComEC/Rec2 n=1 Tax=Macrococcus equi TaxID=3395462 RepID=UPI0039BE6C46